MKYIRVWAAVVVFVLGVAAPRASAQSPTALQRLHFNFFNDYEVDRLGTNATTTNVSSYIRTAQIVDGNVARAVYYELAGELWTNLQGMLITREVNVTNGLEGIYLRGFGKQSNISSYFANDLGDSYTNNFTGQVTNQFAGVTNNFLPGLPIKRGFIATTNGLSKTNNLRSEKMFFVSFDTGNMKFNFIGYGTAVPHFISGRVTPGGEVYSNIVDSFTAHGVGTMYRTGNSNVFYPGTPPYVTNLGIIYGTISSDSPTFLALTNGP
jgi:hypothetical protein